MDVIARPLGLYKLSGHESCSWCLEKFVDDKSRIIRLQATTHERTGHFFHMDTCLPMFQHFRACPGRPQA